MAKNRLSMLPKQQTPTMSPAHPHTVGAAAASLLNPDDEEDKDILCPVCDGECTCDNVFPQSMSPTQHSIQFIGSSSSSVSSRPYPSSKSTPLKIKLTVPPTFLGNKQHGLSSSRFGSSTEMTSALAHDGEASHSITRPSVQSYPLPSKRSGRPQKASIVSRGPVHLVQSASPSPSLFTQPFIPKNVGNTKHKGSGLPPKQDLKAGRSGPKRPQKRKRRAASDEDGDSSLSDLTDADHHCDGDDDGGSVSFPTFVSASAFSSVESGNSSDSSDLSESETPSFVSDSEIEQEEESFIVSDVHQKARLRRELLGDDDLHTHDPHGDWIIRPRKRSVGSSGSEMNVDSEGTGEEEDEEEEEEDQDEDAEETDGKSGGTGLVTAWSEGDESSFDADLFFANLTDSDSNTDSSCSPSEDGGGEDGDLSDMDTASCNDIAQLVAERQESENLRLEVTEGWDGQIVFTNGLSDDRGILDIDFEVDTSQFMVEADSSPTHDSDMDTSPASVGISDGGGYEEDDGDCGGEGDTTDEDLVGEDDLPNERAMKMFNLPFNVSAIDPLSTVSPVVSPAPFRRAPFSRNGCLGAPKPEDILSGKVYWDSDDHDCDSPEEKRSRSRSQDSGKGNGPRTGLFVPVQETRRAIIDGSKEVPSPHPRFNRHRSRSDATSINLVEQMLRKHMLTSRSMSTFTTASELLSPLQPLSSDNDFGSSSSLALATLTEEFEPLPGTIGLDDVLEASVLAPESSESARSTNNHSKRAVESTDEDDILASGKHLQNLSRWDLISVGAFRQTRENGGWRSDCTHPHTPHSSVDYGSIMKASPLSSIMWPKEKKEKEKAKEKERRRRKRQDPMAISPVILPIRDGDRTPTGSGNQQQNDLNHKSNKHSRRKETKKERKLKKKSWGPVHHQHSHHQWHHTHQHHPNSKTRGSAATQRPFLAAVPPFNL